jgi:hypothetical protein
MSEWKESEEYLENQKYRDWAKTPEGKKKIASINGFKSKEDMFKRIEDQMKRLANPKLDAFGTPIPLTKPRPCEEKPPRFSDKDCKECPDRICEINDPKEGEK